MRRAKAAVGGAEIGAFLGKWFLTIEKGVMGGRRMEFVATEGRSPIRRHLIRIEALGRRRSRCAFQMDEYEVDLIVGRSMAL